MNGAPAPGQGPPPLQNLVKPEMIARLPYFPEDQKPKYIQGVTKLWETIRTRPNDSPEHQGAYKKLIEVSISIKRMVEERKAQAGANPAQGTAAATAGSGASNQNGVRLPNQQPQPEQRAQSQSVPGQPTAEQTPQKYLEKAEQIKIVVPPQIMAQHGPEMAQTWIRSHKQKYATALHKYDQMKGKIEQMQLMVEQRNKSGKPLNAQEMEALQAQTAKFQSTRETALDWLRQFTSSQEQVKAQMQTSQKGNMEADAPAQVPKQEPSASTASISQAPESLNQGNITTSAQESTSKDSNTVPGRPSASSPPVQEQVPALQQRPPTSQAINANQPIVQPLQAPDQNTVVKAEVQSEQKMGAPTIPPIHHAHHAEPQPLKHEDALERARTYSQPGYPQNIPPTSSHAHPPSHNQREGQPNSHAKMPVPKELNIPPTQPVPMGQSRPTLTNGPMMGGPIGQPAMQKTPGYVLEGDGERILSKKKLQELVRQVTGGSGTDDEESEKLSAEVEEVSRTTPCGVVFTGFVLTSISADITRRGRRIRRPSHRQRLQTRQAASIVNARTPRHPAHPRTQLQHPRSGVCVGRTPHRSKDPTRACLDPETQRCAGGESHRREGGSLRRETFFLEIGEEFALGCGRCFV